MLISHTALRDISRNYSFGIPTSSGTGAPEAFTLLMYLSRMLDSDSFGSIW
jgi:hypothetical protein